mgnify:CR=1 FL=1
MSKKIFYVCSYGGSGSKMLCKALGKYGKVKHIHSRNPPDKLTYVGKEKGGNTYCEWFNKVPIPENNLKNYSVLLEKYNQDLKNAEDILLERNRKNRHIHIAYERLEHTHKLSFSDNAGGIPEKIINNIFEEETFNSDGVEL